MSDLDLRPRALRPASLATGVFLLVVYASLGAEVGYRVKFGGGPQHALEYIGSGELRFWLSHALLVVPGVLAICHGLWPLTAGVARRVGARIDAFGSREWRLAAFAFFALLFVVAQLGRQHLLLDLPVTDDENAIRFGGKILATGKLRVPVLEPEGSYTDVFTFERDGYVSSMDYPGAIAFSALAEVTGLRSLAYALAAAVTGLAVALTARRLLGARAAVLAGVLWLASPMVFTLSLTTHAHVVSRCCVAVALLLYVMLATRRDDESFLARAFALGLVTGAGFLARPAEVGSLMALPGLHLAWRALRGERDGRAVVAAATLGLIGPLLLFGAYNAELTGSYFTEPRRAAGARIDGITQPGTPIASRLGGHGAFNLWMLAVWFLGPLGLPLAWLGVARRHAVSCVLMAALVAALSVTLLHDNVGIHAVGPIHYSESAVPLALLALLGVERLRRLAEAHHLHAAFPSTLVAGYCAGAMGIFLLHYGGELRAQAEFQAIPFRHLERAGVHHAVVVGLDPGILDRVRNGTTASSWVLKFPHPDPLLRDDIIFARADADIAALREHFPTRDFHRLVYRVDGPPVETQWFAGPGANPDPADRLSLVQSEPVSR